MADEDTGTTPTSTPVVAAAAPGKTFSQEDVDRIVQERLAKAERNSFTRLGFATEEDAKSAKSTLGAVEAALKTANDQLSSLTAEQATDKQSLAASKIRTEAVLAAAKIGIRPDAIDQALKIIDLSKVEVSETGEISGVTEAFAPLTTEAWAKGFFAGTLPAPTFPTNPPVGSTHNTISRKQIAEWTAKGEFAAHEAEIDKAAREGRITN